MMYPGALDLFGWKIYFARAAAMSTLLWSALLYLTMSRSLIKWLRAQRFAMVRGALDAHKEAHVFSGQCLFVDAFIHIIAHVLGTVPALQKHTSEEVNDIIGCASAPQVPRCEVQVALAPMSTRARQEHGFQEIMFFGTSATTSGVALTCSLILLSLMARAQARSRHFDRFIHVHNVVFMFWPLLLFVHGAAGMSGVGLPLGPAACLSVCICATVSYIC